MVALPTADDLVAFGVSALHLILARQFQGTLDRFGASAGKENGAIAKRRSCEIQNFPRKFFGNISREIAGVGELELRRLLGHGASNRRIAVPDKIDDGATGKVENLAAASVIQPYSFATNGDRIRLIQNTMQDSRPRNRDRKGIFLHGRIIPTIPMC